MHNIQSKKRANASLLYGNRSGLIFSPTLFLRFAKGARTRFAQTIAPFYATLRAFA